MESNFSERNIRAKLFSGDKIAPETILDIYRFQYHNNLVYKQWCDALARQPENVDSVQKIPYLPIQYFKTQKVVAGNFEPQLIFESSGTTQTEHKSQHLIKDASLYEDSFVQGFRKFYGEPSDYCIIGLLPNYLERNNSSLIKMVNDLIALSGHPQSGFYLYEFDKLATVLEDLEQKGQKTWLIGVTFALLDFAESHPMNLSNTIIMETGGMKGRKKEMTREEVHQVLTSQLGVSKIHSEYGMTELLSQGYSFGEGLYQTPEWMQVFVREETDPLSYHPEGQGILNVMDLANLYSCSFIATDDVGKIYPDGQFEVRGRLDLSDIRGCNLLIA